MKKHKTCLHNLDEECENPRVSHCLGQVFFFSFCAKYKIVQNLSLLLSLFFPSLLSSLKNLSVRDVAEMTSTRTRMLQANSLVDVKEKLSLFTKEQWVSSGRIGFCQGITISWSYKRTRFSVHKTVQNDFLHVGKLPRPVAQLLMSLVHFAMYHHSRYKGAHSYRSCVTV